MVGPSECLDEGNEDLFYLDYILRVVLLLMLKSVGSPMRAGIGEMNHKFSKLSPSLFILEARSTLNLLLCNPTINRIGNYEC